MARKIPHVEHVTSGDVKKGSGRRADYLGIVKTEICEQAG